MTLMPEQWKLYNRLSMPAWKNGIHCSKVMVVKNLDSKEIGLERYGPAFMPSPAPALFEISDFDRCLVSACVTSAALYRLLLEYKPAEWDIGYKKRTFAKRVIGQQALQLIQMGHVKYMDIDDATHAGIKERQIIGDKLKVLERYTVEEWHTLPREFAMYQVLTDKDITAFRKIGAMESMHTLNEFVRSLME